MEKFIQRENVLLEFGSSRGMAENSGKTSNKNTEEMDFNDVFGGPPRRYSMQEVRVRYSFGESGESEEERASSPWIVMKEKPVFGEENAARRRHQGDGFYDDIFKADESRVSSPRKSDRDREGLLWSSPSSRNLSPARRSPSKADLLGTSLPAQLSLPAKSSKAVELPAFGSQDYKTDDSRKVVNSPRSTGSSFSRFLTQAIKGKDENRNEHQSVIRPSPLSREPSLSSEDSSSKISSKQKGNIVEKVNKETKIVDNDGSQFHFSIYTWAGVGVPMVMPLLDANQVKSKDTGKYNKSASSNLKMGGDSSESQKPTATNQDLSATAVAESLKMESGKKDLKTKDEAKEPQVSTEEKIHEIPEPKAQKKAKDRVNLVGARRTTKSVKVKTVDEIDQREKTAKKVAMTIKEVLKSKGSTVRESNEAEQPGKVSEAKEIKTGSAKGSSSDERISKNVKKKEGTRMDSDSANVEKSSLLSGVTPSKSGVKGKVKEFVQIFNQDIDSKPKDDVQTRSQSARWKAVNFDQTENEVSVNAEKVKENVNLHNVDKKPDVPLKVDKNLKDDEPKQSSFTKNPSRRSDRSFTSQKKSSSSDSLHRDRTKSLDADDPFEVNFVVEELFDDQEKVAQSGEGSEDMTALDAKIRQWSVGKKGNIRSLLSTLQYVLWPGSGWKPVPLVDLIEANSVKRAYQKALLRIHPDKLQQKGAESTQKFIAEKVFDILQEAWDHFNTLAPL